MKLYLAALLTFLPCVALAQVSPATSTSAPDAESKVAVIFSGGHDTVGEDRGRPVILIAAALNVPPDVFRAVFRNVHPAPAGQQPDPAQVVKNKQALMAGLGPYGVTDDRLNTVSNYYRYRRSSGEMWRNTPAEAYATVKNGVVTSITITNAGSGYSSPPQASIPGMPNVNLTTSLAFGTDFATNGSIKEIKVGP
jgi:hypothetical protein